MTTNDVPNGAKLTDPNIWHLGFGTPLSFSEARIKDAAAEKAVAYIRVTEVAPLQERLDLPIVIHGDYVERTKLDDVLAQVDI